MEVGKAIKIISLVLVTFLVSLIILELAIRTYSVFFFPRMMRFDETLGWSHTPNAEKVFVNEYGEHSLVIQNKFGLRGEPYPLEKTYFFFREVEYQRKTLGLLRQPPLPRQVWQVDSYLATRP